MVVKENDTSRKLVKKSEKDRDKKAWALGQQVEARLPECIGIFNGHDHFGHGTSAVHPNGLTSKRLVVQKMELIAVEGRYEVSSSPTDGDHVGARCPLCGRFFDIGNMDGRENSLLLRFIELRRERRAKKGTR